MSQKRQRGATDKLAEALSAGRLWRAKEILGGRMGSLPFSAALCEQYGLLLLRMGDDLEAGKFLFLSGQQRPEYQPAIDLFVQRYSRAGWQSLVAALPIAARRSPWSELPEKVRSQLLAAGAPTRPGGEPLRATLQKYPQERPGWRGCLMVLLAVIAIGLLLAAMVAYFFKA